MYGFVEKEIANILVDNGIITAYEVYSISSGDTLAIIGRETFNFTVNTMRGIVERHYSEDFLRQDVVPVNSDITGMFTVLHPFWNNTELFDAITPGAVKESPSYLKIKSVPQKDVSIFLDIFRRVIEGTDNAEVQEGANHIVVDEIVTVSVGNAINVATEAVPEISTSKSIIYESISRYLRSNYIYSEGEYIVAGLSDISAYGYIIDFANKMKKHVIIISGVVKNYMTSLRIEKFNDEIIYINTYVAPPKFVTGPTMEHTLFGYEFSGLMQIHVPPTRDGEKKVNVFENYDYIYRDFKTGLIWALQKGNTVSFIVGSANNIGYNLWSIIYKELGERYLGALPYQEMLKRDEEYFKLQSVNNKYDFISLGINSAQSMIKELKNSYLEAKEKYSDFMDKALEYAKTAQRLEESIVMLNEEKIEKEERTRCEKAYEDIMTIPNVSTVKIVDKNVHVYTKNIYIFNEKDKTWHDIGAFHIVIGMYSTKYDTSSTVRIYNTKHQVHAFEELMQAPHVFGDGHLCHGNITSVMIDAYRRRDLYQLVTMLIMFLESANLDDAAGAYLFRWPVVSEEEAKRKDKNIMFEFEGKNDQEEKFDRELNIPLNI